MRSATEYLWFETKKHREFIRITDTVAGIVTKSGVQEGFCLVSAMHTSNSGRRSSRRAEWTIGIIRPARTTATRT